MLTAVAITLLLEFLLPALFRKAPAFGELCFGVFGDELRSAVFSLLNGY
jgi:hypothetical protein